MTYLRLLRLLDRFAHVLRRLPFKDRWGFPLGDDLCDWLMIKRWVYVDRVEKAGGFRAVETVGPRCRPDRHVGSNITISVWPSISSCDKCAASTTYTTGRIAS